MISHRFVEFFESEDGRLSMTRLLCFLSFFPAAYIAITHPTSDIYGFFLGTYVLGYVGGKGVDGYVSAAKTKAENKKPVIVPDAKTVKVDAQGDVNITKEKDDEK